MRIKGEEVGFQDIVNVGRFAYIIHVPFNEFTAGVDVDQNELVKKAIHFPTVIVSGESFLERDEMSAFLKKLKRKKPEINIVVETLGNIRPVAMGTIDVDYIVRLGPDSTISNINALTWFVEAESKFVFFINTLDDIDGVDLVLQRYGIPKHMAYLVPNIEIQLEEFMRTAKAGGYNFSFRLSSLLEGEHD